MPFSSEAQKVKGVILVLVTAIARGHFLWFSHTHTHTLAHTHTPFLGGVTEHL